MARDFLVELNAGTLSVGTINSGTINAGTVTNQSMVLLSTIVATVGTTAATTAYGTITGLDKYKSINAYFNIKGVGGTAVTSHILQNSFDGGATWVDYARTPTVGSGNSTIVVFTAAAENPSFSTMTAIGTGLVPQIAANTLVNGEFGDRLRLVATVNAGGTNNGTTTLNLISKT